MLKLMMTVAIVFVTTSLTAAEPASFTVEAATKGVRVKFANFEGTAEKATYDEVKGTLLLTGAVELTQRSQTGVQKVIQAKTLLYQFRDGSILMDGVGSVSQKQRGVDPMKNTLVGKWQCPPQGRLPGGKEIGPLQIVLEFSASGLAKMEMNTTGPAGGKSTTNGTYRVSPVVDGVLSTDLIARGEPIKFEFKGEHLILTVPNEGGTRNRPDTLEFRRIVER